MAYLLIYLFIDIFIVRYYRSEGVQLDDVGVINLLEWSLRRSDGLAVDYR